MNKINANKRSLRRLIVTIAIIAILISSVVFLWLGTRNTSQSASSMIAGVSFQGEYKIGDGEWRPITPGEHIPSTEGDVTLKGIFMMHNPTTGEALNPVSAGSTVKIYLNHIGGMVILPSGGKIPFDAEYEVLGEDACAIMFSSVPSMGEEPVTIVLQNPHSYGNENAIDEFFAHMSIAPTSLHGSLMLEMGESERNVGILIFISSLIILGIAAFSTVIHLKYSNDLWMIGLMTFFAGGYFLFDAFAVSIWNDPYIFNTRALGLCIMLYMLFSTLIVVTRLDGIEGKIGWGAFAVSVISVVSCIFASLFGDIKFYDTWFWWAIVESAVALTLIVCQIIHLRTPNNAKRFFCVVGSITLTAFIIDVIATKLGWWQGGIASKNIFLAVFIMVLVIVARVIPSHINAAIKARELEAEKQALKAELQESKISIMLSQMQPHFIFNTLNTIYHLCEFDPEIARSTINSFSKYLRNNIDNLGHSDMISFEKEMSFVKNYLDIEKVRFDDELEINFDIAVTNFKLPVLTVQPIVENAVKHGTSKKEGVSTISISTRETEAYYEIEIRDTGVGFETNGEPGDEHKHVGITNVRQRLEHLCDGTLDIESALGEGTTATIRIPKKESLQI